MERSVSFAKENNRVIGRLSHGRHSLAAAMFFDDNPRYIQVGHDDTTESYVDMNSIQSIRYDPPYYIIKAPS